MMKHLQWLLLPCREAARLASAALDRPLTSHEHRALWFHRLLCRWCRRYEKQLHLLQALLHREPAAFHPPGSQRLSPEATARIKRALQP